MVFTCVVCTIRAGDDEIFSRRTVRVNKIGAARVSDRLKLAASSPHTFAVSPLRDSLTVGRKSSYGIYALREEAAAGHTAASHTAAAARRRGL